MHAAKRVCSQHLSCWLRAGPLCAVCGGLLLHRSFQDFCAGPALHISYHSHASAYNVGCQVEQHGNQNVAADAALERPV
eukprot:17323-Heterococcus_DN1.PRE.2